MINMLELMSVCNLVKIEKNNITTILMAHIYQNGSF
jgi:hypothetical protein